MEIAPIFNGICILIIGFLIIKFIGGGETTPSPIQIFNYSVIVFLVFLIVMFIGNGMIYYLHDKKQGG